MAAVRTNLVLAALVVGALTAGCSAAATPDSTSATTPPATTITPAAPGTSGALPTRSASASASEVTGLPHAEGPIPGTTAASITKAWAAYWHATPTPYTDLGLHLTRLTVDFPSAHGQLYMVVGRLSAEATAASSILCELSDASLGLDGYIALSRKAAAELVSGCAGPALKSGETKQVTDYVASHDKPDSATPCPGGGTCRSSDHRVDLERFQLVVQTGPGHIVLYLLGRKA